MTGIELFTVHHKERTEIKVKKSRFIATVLPVSSFKEAERKIKKIKGEFKNATHHPYALRIGYQEVEERYSDNGEPPKSSGFPILQELKRANLTNTLIVVTRYFGGIKLGLGGLNRAYRESALLVIDAVEKERSLPLVRFKLVFERGLFGKIKNILGHFDARIIKEWYGNQSIYVIEVKEEQKEKFVEGMKNITRGKINIKEVRKNGNQD